jgi:catechol 2,3-dioxygenase-like lactoylglutathione lyase family enzyme
MRQRITLVTLLVPDYEAGIAFYVRTLGFGLLEDVDLGGDKRWVRVSPPSGGVALLLAKASGPEQTAAIGNQAGGRVSFFLETDNFDRDFTRYRLAGVEFREDPREEPYGKVAVFADPFGNLWDLIQPAP